MEGGPERLRDRVRIAPAHFPEWDRFEDSVQRGLDVVPGESSAFVAIPTLVELPDVLIGDWARVAQELGWPVGKLVSYLALQGAMKVTAEALRHPEN